MEALTKGLSMGFALFLFMLAFLTTQEFMRKSEALLYQVDKLRNEQAVMVFQAENGEH